MPTNANTFNSRVTSESLEAKFRQVFPAQGGAELVQDLFASGVIQPVVDFSNVAEGSILPPNLQTAWDFATGSAQVSNATTTVINNAGFWKVQVNLTNVVTSGATRTAQIRITDGVSNKPIWAVFTNPAGTTDNEIVSSADFVVFLRSGDSLQAVSTNLQDTFDIAYRQIADVNGTLVNPLGFTFS